MPPCSSGAGKFAQRVESEGGKSRRIRIDTRWYQSQQPRHRLPLGLPADVAVPARSHRVAASPHLHPRAFSQRLQITPSL